MGDPFDGILERATAAADPRHHAVGGVGPFPAEPAFESSEAVERAAEVLRPIYEADGAPSFFLGLLAPGSALDELCALWVDRAPRFGAVTAHFPESLRKRRFVASFWAPEVLLFGVLYTGGWTRPMVDEYCSASIDLWARLVPPRRAGFWSPGLPEVVRVDVLDGLAIPPQLFVRLTVGAWPRLRFLQVLLLLLCVALPAVAQTLRGPAFVVDGDTLEVQGERVRLHGIDAPEKDQLCARPQGAPYHCGALAVVRLEELIGGRPVRCLGAKRDRYKRLIARCYVVGERGPALDLGGALVVRGLALAYRKYSLDYADAEATARAARAGMWAGSFVTPEEWRKGVR